MTGRKNTATSEDVSSNYLLRKKYSDFPANHVGFQGGYIMILVVTYRKEKHSKMYLQRLLVQSFQGHPETPRNLPSLLSTHA